MTATNGNATAVNRGVPDSISVLSRRHFTRVVGRSQPAFTFVLPESFEPADVLKTAHDRLHDDARYLVSTILGKTARGHVDGLGIVRLHAAHLRRVMHFRFYHHVVEALLDSEAIERLPYAVGDHSYGYRLNKRFVADKHVRVPVTNPRLIARLKAFHTRADAERLLRMRPVHNALARQQNRLRIDGDRAREILDSLPAESNPFDVQGILVADIEQREFHCNVGRYGRLSNNVTSMKREVRKSLNVGGKRLSGVDLSCAQPALVAKIIRDKQQHKENETGRATGQREAGAQKGRTPSGSIYDVQGFVKNDALATVDRAVSACSELRESQRHFLQIGDFALYQHLTQTGTFYDYVLAELGVSSRDMPRDVLKRKFLADVLAKKKANARGAEYPSLVEVTFQRLFPTVYRFIREFNRDGWEHANLIRELQRQESNLVIETVAADLVTRYPTTFFLTLHDAIYSMADHLPKVERAFHRAFDQANFPMTIKVAG